MKVKTIPRRWGSSLAVIIPKKVVEAQKINETEEIVITIEKPKPKAGVLFGFLKDWKKVDK